MRPGAAVCGAAAGGLLLVLFADLGPVMPLAGTAGIAAWIAAWAAGQKSTAIERPALLLGGVVLVSWALAPGPATPWPALAWLAVACGVGRVAGAGRVGRGIAVAVVTCGATLLGYVAAISAATAGVGADRAIVYPAASHWGLYPELGQLAVVVLPMAVGALLSMRRHRVALAALAVIILVSGIGLVMTYARASWAAAAVAVGLLAAAAPRRGRPLLVVAVVLAIGVGLSAPLTTRLLGELADDRSGPVHSRVDAWRHALDLWRTRPLIGVGPGGYGQAFASRYGGSGDPAARHAHNLPLHVAVEAGLAGLLALTWLVWRAGERAWTALRAADPGTVEGALLLGAAGALVGAAARLQLDYVDPAGPGARVFLLLAVVVGLCAGLRPSPTSTSAEPA